MENSLLNRLPRELRDKIYEYAVVPEDGIIIKPSTRLDGHTAVTITGSPRTRQSALALAKTCKQLHNETSNLYYQLNTFYFPFDWIGVELFKLFLRSLKTDHYNSVRHVVFRAPDRHLYWRRRTTDGLLSRWYGVMQQIVSNATKLLPGPIYVGGHFTFDCSPDKTHPKGHFDLVVDMNRIEESLEENWQVASALNQYFSYGSKGTALELLYEPMAVLKGHFFVDDQRSGVESQADDGDASKDEDKEEEDESIPGADPVESMATYDDVDDDDIPEDGKLDYAARLGDQYFARASGLRL